MEEKTHLQRVIEDYLKASERSARDLSLAVGDNDSLVKAILSGKSVNPRRDTLEKLAAEMKRPAADLIAAAAALEDDDELPPPNVRPAPDAPEPAFGHFPVDIEVLGTAVGGSSGEFMFNGQTVDRIRRLPGIARLTKVYAIYVAGESMSPWREPGDPVYFSDTRPARPGNHVIVELHPTKKHENGIALLKRYRGQAGSKIRLAQYNPPDDNILIDMARVRVIHRVFEWPELILS